MFTAHRHVTVENTGKTEALLPLFPAFRIALGGLGSLTRREILAGQELRSWRAMPEGSLPFGHDLSGRQMKSAQNMVHANVSGWQELLVDRVRELISGSDLSEERKTVLYRVNARKAWWAKSLNLPWIGDTDDGRLVPCTAKQAAKDPAAVYLSVAEEDLFLIRRLAKQAQKAVRYPDLRRTGTLVLNSTAAGVAPAGTAVQDAAVGWWVNISTLTPRKPVQVPLASNPYFERKYRDALAAGGRMAGAVQLHLTRDAHGQPSGVAVSLVLETPDAPARTEGDWLGLDFGFGTALLATSQGQLLGQAMLFRLRELDRILEPYAADLQRRGISLKTDPYYQQLQSRIRKHRPLRSLTVGHENSSPWCRRAGGCVVTGAAGTAGCVGGSGCAAGQSRGILFPGVPPAVAGTAWTVRGRVSDRTPGALWRVTTVAAMSARFSVM